MTEIIDIVEPAIPGSKGDQGPAGEIVGATATALPTGAEPTVQLGGTPSERTIEFGLPRGPKGDPGAGSVNSVDGDFGPDIELPYASTVGTGKVGLATSEQVIAGSTATPPKAVTPAGARTLHELRGVSPESFGAVGDGLANDSAAFQAAIDSMPNGGVLTLTKGAEYSLPVTVVLRSNTTIEGNGAVLRKRAGADERCVFSNLSAPNAKGYGAGGRNITIRNVKFVGDYSIPVAQYKDICVSFHHVDGLRVEGCDFEQGMHNSHYLDLLGCSDVSITNCTFSGMRPISGREYIEAIQIDSSTRGGASFDREEITSYDGLPCRDVRVIGCLFQGLNLGGTYYEMPTALGTHGGALTTDDGYIQGVTFSNNQCVGHYTPYTGFWVGLVTLPGARGVVISDNVFRWTGAPVNGSAAVINMAGLGSVVPLSEVQKTPATSEAITPYRGPQDWVIRGNSFVGFENGPADNSSGLIYSSTRVGDRIVISNNVVGGSRSPALWLNFIEAASTHNVRVDGNIFKVNSDRPVYCAYFAFAQLAASGNTFECSNGQIGVYIINGHMVNIQGNSILNGSYAMIVANLNNGVIQNNLFYGYGVSGMLIGDAGDSGTVFDLSLTANRFTSSPVGTKKSVTIGSKATRLFRFGNRYRDGGPIEDNGSGSIANTALDTN